LGLAMPELPINAAALARRLAGDDQKSIRDEGFRSWGKDNQVVTRKRLQMTEIDAVTRSQITSLSIR